MSGWRPESWVFWKCCSWLSLAVCLSFPWTVLRLEFLVNGDLVVQQSLFILPAAFPSSQWVTQAAVGTGTRLLHCSCSRLNPLSLKEIAGWFPNSRWFSSCTGYLHPSGLVLSLLWAGNEPGKVEVTWAESHQEKRLWWPSGKSVGSNSRRDRIGVGVSPVRLGHCSLLSQKVLPSLQSLLGDLGQEGGGGEERVWRHFLCYRLEVTRASPPFLTAGVCFSSTWQRSWLCQHTSSLRSVCPGS